MALPQAKSPVRMGIRLTSYELVSSIHRVIKPDFGGCCHCLYFFLHDSSLKMNLEQMKLKILNISNLTKRTGFRRKERPKAVQCQNGQRPKALSKTRCRRHLSEGESSRRECSLSSVLQLLWETKSSTHFTVLYCPL